MPPMYEQHSLMHDSLQSISFSRMMNMGHGLYRSCRLGDAPVGLLTFEAHVTCHDVWCGQSYGGTPIIYASQEGHLTVVTVLASRGAIASARTVR
jgi:hypothetical protein